MTPAEPHPAARPPHATDRAGICGTLLACAGFAGIAGLATFVGPWAEHLGSFLVVYGIAWCGMAVAAQGRIPWPIVLAGAVLFRGILLPHAPSLSDDVYRYVWEGRVQNAGFDPYVLSPLAPQLEPLRDALWQRVNHPQYTAIYPPVAELVFRALAPWGGVLLFKTALCALDLGTCAVLACALRRGGRSPARLVYYAWNPLVVVEVAGSGHLEPLGVLPLVAAVVWISSRRTTGWVLLAVSVAVKYAAAIALPACAALAPPRKWAIGGAVLVLAAVFAPYAGAGSHLFDSLRVYAEHWRYNDLLFALIQRVEPDPHRARVVAVALAGAGGLGLALWRRPLAERVLAALSLTLLLSPTIHPWYLVWPLAVLPLAPASALVAWSATLPVAYLYLFPAFGHGPYASGSWVPKLLEVAPVALALLGLRLRRAAARTRAATGA